MTDSQWGRNKISIIGTRSARLRARVQISGMTTFQVTVGGSRWQTLSKDIKREVLRCCVTNTAALCAQQAAALKDMGPCR